MNTCVFCKVVRGEKEVYLIAESEHALAFLDHTPRTKGHTLVIPKQHCRRVYEIEATGEFFEFVRYISQAILDSLHADWIQYVTIGEAVEHAHLHVLPRYESDGHGVVVDFGKRFDFTNKEMSEICEKIGGNIKSSEYAR